ncbi:MAG: hypothetical protein HOP13_04165 [Alphaproteobacteria bacterium]|nr:hypothetical protein [Alphaproteobacteria bacterium]
MYRPAIENGVNMTQRGILVGAAFVLAAVAAGVFFWTQNVPLPSAVSSLPSDRPPAAPPSEPSSEQKLVKTMNERAVGGGYAATFSEREGAQWTVSDGHRLERLSIGGGTVLARLSSGKALTADMMLGGVHLELPEQFATTSNGQKIEVGLVARRAKTNSSDTISVIYLTRQAGNSGWQTFSLADDFQLNTFEYSVPQVVEGYTAKPIVAIYGDLSGSDRGVEILGVYIKLKQ